MFRKITSFMLAAAMLLSLMTGCAVTEKKSVEDAIDRIEEQRITLDVDTDEDADEDADESNGGVGRLGTAVYPESVRKVSSEDYFRKDGTFNEEAFEQDEKAWDEVWKEQRTLSEDLQERLMPFYQAASVFLQHNEGENRVCSPLNIYIALAMLAEAAEGETRAEILSVLGADSMEDARDLAVRLWRTNYVDNGELLTDIASSLWLRKGLSVNEDALKQVVESYFADVFEGDPEDPAYSKELQHWLNEKTHGLLDDAVQGVEMDPEMALSLASTVYFRGKWQYPFDSASNKTMTFHGTAGDTEAEFMYKKTDDQYFFYDHFGAVRLQMSGGDSMWLILPDEGYTPEEIAAEQDFVNCVTLNSDGNHMKFTMIDLSVPKFDVASDVDLGPAMKELGIRRVFDMDQADFSGLIAENREELPVYLSKVQHAGRCMIDEEGCIATAFTLEMLCGAAMPDGSVEFTLDRPFVFAVTSYTGAILFTGIVNQLP